MKSTTTKKQAESFIRENATQYCRTLREGAKYLQGKLTPYELPHLAVWWEVLKYASGLNKDERK